MDLRISEIYEEYGNNGKCYNESYLLSLIKNHIEIMSNINHHLWKDDNNNFYYKTFNADIISGTKEYISNIISQDIQKNILIINNIDSINNSNQQINTYTYLLVNLIPYHIFNPFVNLEAYCDLRLNKHFVNIFRYSDYLKPRLSHKEHLNYMKTNSSENYSNSFIKKFIFHLVTNKDDYNTIINWLSGFFKTLIKSDIAINLVGDKEASQEIFIDEIIKPIFGTDFCTTITAKMIKEQSNGQIIKDKIFYHIGTLPYFTARSKKTKQLLSDIVTKNTIPQEITTDTKQNNVHIFGQTLITSNKANTKLIEKIKNNCKIIEINDLATIIEKLGCTKAYFYRELEKDLFNFSSFLLKFKLDKKVSDKLDRDQFNNPYLGNILETSYKIN